jgi:hypothetical protein
MSLFSAWIILSLLGLALLWGWDRQMELNDLKKELTEYLGDLEVARDISEPHLRVHFAATASHIKFIIKNHFKI